MIVADFRIIIHDYSIYIKNSLEITKIEKKMGITIIAQVPTIFIPVNFDT